VDRDSLRHDAPLIVEFDFVGMADRLAMRRLVYFLAQGESVD
jgi:hypothetical protein